MKKRIIMMVTLTVFSGLLTACGGGKEEVAQKEEAVDVSAEKQEVKTEETSDTTETKENNQFTIIEDVMQYADGTFDVEGILQAPVEKFSVYETENKVEVYWYDETSEQLYRSVAEGGKWTETNKLLGEFKVYNGNRTPVIVGRTIVTVQDDQNSSTGVGIKAVTFDENDGISSEKTFPTGGFNTGIASNGEKALIIDNNIYLSGNFEKPIAVNDPHEILDEGNFYFDQENSNIVISDSVDGGIDQTFKTLNIETGEPVYDENGKDLTFANKAGDEKLLGGFNQYSIFRSDYDGLFHLYDGNKEPVTSLGVENVKEDASYAFTTTRDEIHIWISEEFQRKQVLRLVKIAKGQ